MSTLQQTSQQALRTHSRRHLALAAMLVLVAAAAATIVLILSGGSSSHPIVIGGPGTGEMHGTPQQELQAVSGARYGVTRPNASTVPRRTENASPTPAQLTTQLQAVAGARYAQPGQSGHGRNPSAVR